MQGRSIPKGERGQITGLATTVAGLVAITLGVLLRVFGGEDLSAGQLAWLLAAGAALWVAVAAVYSGIREPAGEPVRPVKERGKSGEARSLLDVLRVLRTDRPFRHFVVVRSLLLVSSLSPPFVVALSIESGSDSLVGLGGFVIASGLAALLGGRIFGRLADRSSKRLMSVGAGAASAVIAVTIIVVALPQFSSGGWLGSAVFIGAYFLLTLMHTGVRVGRQTYLIDMAEGQRRTIYTAVSNSAMGVILLIVGAISSALAVVHIAWALIFLAAMGLAGVIAGARLPEVSRGRE